MRRAKSHKIPPAYYSLINRQTPLDKDITYLPVRLDALSFVLTVGIIIFCLYDGLDFLLIALDPLSNAKYLGFLGNVFAGIVSIIIACLFLWRLVKMGGFGKRYGLFLCKDVLLLKTARIDFMLPKNMISGIALEKRRHSFRAWGAWYEPVLRSSVRNISLINIESESSKIINIVEKWLNYSPA